MSVPEELSHQTTISGTFNGIDFEMKGKGKGRPYDGTLETLLESTKGPLGFPMPIIDIVMQLPTYSRHHEGTTDMFKRSNAYEYERRIRFENGGTMEILNKINRSDSNLVGDMRVVKAQCNDIPDLMSLEPVVETLIPAGPGVLRSKCVLLWRRKDNGWFRADCETEYRLRNQDVIQGVQYLAMSYETDHSQVILSQKASMDVFRSYPRKS